MVRGIESFKNWFHEYEDRYVIIGGTACDLLMNEGGLEFRATKDIDLVLIVEAVDARFGAAFWKYIESAGYEHRNKSTGELQFYRFTKPVSRDYPMMIELFARKPEIIELPDNAVISPVPLDDDISSLSAILLDDDYYEFLKQGRVKISGVTILDAQYLIPFKAKAWLDLLDKQESGVHVDSKDIRKHKNDVFRLTVLLPRDPVPLSGVPATVRTDMKVFIDKMKSESIDLKQLGIYNKTKEIVLDELAVMYT